MTSELSKTLAYHVEALIQAMPNRPARPVLAARIGIGDKTLGFLKAGTGNPTLASIEAVASYFRRQPWQLLVPPGGDSSSSQPARYDAEILSDAMALLDAHDRVLGLPTGGRHNPRRLAIACEIVAEELDGETRPIGESNVVRLADRLRKETGVVESGDQQGAVEGTGDSTSGGTGARTSPTRSGRK